MKNYNLEILDTERSKLTPLPEKTNPDIFEIDSEIEDDEEAD